METNYTKFNRAFNTLHNAIEQRIGNKKQRNFGASYYEALNRNDHLIMRHKEKIDFYREFRNLTQHKVTLDRPPFAEPSDHLISDILRTIEDIKNPSRVRDIFLSKVATFQVDDKLSQVLKIIETENYSQFPVFDGNKFIGIISENGITAFLAKSVEEDIISIKEIKIKDVLTAIKDEAVGSYSIVGTNKLVYEVEDLFINNTKKGNPRFIVLISHSSNRINKPEDIAGIITPWDMPKMNGYSKEKVVIN